MTYKVFGGTLSLTQSINLRDVEALFLWDSDSDFRVKKFRTPDDASDSSTKKPALCDINL